MPPASFSVTINLRLAATVFLAGVATLFFTSWAKLSNQPSVNATAGIAAFSPAVSKHTVMLSGKSASYTAKAGYLGIGNQKRGATANIFYTAYTLNQNTGSAKRAITFVFNGGPGSAAIWLHMGAFGPVRVGGDGKVVANANTWLGFTNLVFIDPVGTGYSRPADGIEAKQFYGYREDIRSIAAFIKAYLAENQQEDAPVFLAGESYGALRAVGLAEELQANSKVKIAGLTLISPALNYQLISFRGGNETAYAYYLPTYAVTAQYHHKLGVGLQQLSAEELMARASSFGQGTYARFLSLGDAAPGELTGKVIDSLQYFTGLSRQYLEKVNGRITDIDFTKQLLGENNQTIGTFDSRVAATAAPGDPSIAAIHNSFTSGFKQYVSEELKYINELPYLATTATNGWNYGQEGTNSYINAAGTLKKVMAQNPNLKVNVVGGYYDLATPVAATNYVLNHLGLARDLRKNISVNYYGTGHMFYTSDAANTHFHRHSKTFYAQALMANR